MQNPFFGILALVQLDMTLSVRAGALRAPDSRSQSLLRHPDRQKPLSRSHFGDKPGFSGKQNKTIGKMAFKKLCFAARQGEGKGDDTAAERCFPPSHSL